MSIKHRLDTLEKRQQVAPGVAVVFAGRPGAEEEAQSAEAEGKMVLEVRFVRPKPTRLYT